MHTLHKFIPYYKYLYPVRGKFVLGLLFGIIFSVTSGLGIPAMADTVIPILFGNEEGAPQWLRHIVEYYFANDISGGFLILCSLILPFMILIRALSGWANGYYVNYAGLFMVQNLQKNIFSKIQCLPYAFFKENQTGEIIASVMTYPNEIRRVVADMSNDIIRQPLTLLSAIGFVVYKSFESQSFFISIIAMLSIPVSIYPIRQIAKYLAKRSRQLVSEGESMNSLVIETIQSPVEIRAFNLEDRQKNFFSKSVDKIFQFMAKSIRSSLMISPSIEFVSSIGFGLALYLGVQNGMEEAEFFSLFLALYIAYEPIKRLGRMHGMIRQLEAPLIRVDRILNLEESIQNTENPKSINSPLEGKIEFENVSFAYEDGIEVISSVNLTIDKGKPFAIIGRSGSGKSSFVNLLLRLYDPTSGSIKLDGVDIKDYDLNDLRDHIAYVPQMPLLFKDTIMENIRIGNIQATDAQVLQAAKKANALEFIETFPNSFNTEIGEKGSTLSGGQRQRIAIARALIKDASILIFDEATSALDHKNKMKILSQIREMKDKIIIFISHDLSDSEDFQNKLNL